MRASGFKLVDGDHARGVPAATPRHWLICVVLVIVAQWVLQTIGSPAISLTSLATLYSGLSAYGSAEWIVALPSLAWLIVPFAVVGYATIYLSQRFDGRNACALGLNTAALKGSFPWIIAGLVSSSLSILGYFMLAPGWIAQALSALAFLTPATLIQAGAEEILFRGALLTILVARYGAPRGILISAALFALWHLYAGQQPVDAAVMVVTTFIFGVSSAVLVLHQGHLGGAIALHVVWNLIVSLTAGFASWTGAQGILGMFGSDFWQSYAANAFKPWVIEDFQNGAAVRALFIPLLFETLIVFAACRETIDKILSGQQAPEEDTDIDRTPIKD